MGKRGPHPINVNELAGRAGVWASNLYEVRDGRVGLLEQVDWELIMTGHDRALRSRRVLQAFFIPIGSRMRELPEPLRSRGWVHGGCAIPKQAVRGGGTWWLLLPDKSPLPKIWEKLKRARTIAEMQKALTKILRLLFVSENNWQRKGNKPLREIAAELLQSRRLSSYPRAPEAKRTQSDNKRVAFFAKVLAGVEMGIAPATTIKRLHKRVVLKPKQENERWVFAPQAWNKSLLSKDGQLLPISSRGDEQ